MKKAIGHNLGGEQPMARGKSAHSGYCYSWTPFSLLKYTKKHPEMGNYTVAPKKLHISYFRPRPEGFR